MERKNLKWQTRAEMDEPTNPLQQLHETLARTSRDCSKDKMISFMYGIILGWDDASYEELKVLHNWDNETVNRLKNLNEKYNKAWNLIYDQIAYDSK